MLFLYQILEGGNIKILNLIFTLKGIGKSIDKIIVYYCEFKVIFKLEFEVGIGKVL